jgi:2-dehydro-3-deoxyglucarate aldolase
MAKPGRYDDKDVREVLETYEKISIKMNKPMGYHVIEPDYHLVLEKIEAGYTFIAFSLDTLFLGTICRDQMTQLKKSLS